MSTKAAVIGIMGSKDAIRHGFAAGLLENGDVWMDMVSSRNAARHTYNQETADAILQKCVDSYAQEFERLKQQLEARL